MFRIPPFSKDYPNLFEALQAKKEVDIVEQQSMEQFNSKPVRHVLFEIDCRHRGEQYEELFRVFDAFQYGYILGKRAERKRRNKHTLIESGGAN